MSFEDGHEKFGGRARGTPNKKTSTMAEILNEFSVNPVKAIIELLPSLTPKEQVDVYKDLLTYIHPKRKAAEPVMYPLIKDNDVKEKLDYFKLAEMIKIARDGD